MTTSKIIKDLNKFIDSCKDKREIRRALAVKMYSEGCTLKDIAQYLNVSFQFVGKWKNYYLKGGIQSLKLNYQGSRGYLTRQERTNIVNWLKQQPYCTLEKLRIYIVENYGVHFCSLRSYYKLLKEAHLSFKKSQKVNPKRKAQQVATKRKLLKKNITRENP